MFPVPHNGERAFTPAVTRTIYHTTPRFSAHSAHRPQKAARKEQSDQ
jgi:hypothetical protein